MVFCFPLKNNHFWDTPIDGNPPYQISQNVAPDQFLAAEAQFDADGPRLLRVRDANGHLSDSLGPRKFQSNLSQPRLVGSILGRVAEKWEALSEKWGENPSKSIGLGE